MERYMYFVHPRKPIIGLLPGRAIRKQMGLKLDKEEVLKCMSCGPVYRAFPSIPPIRVTGSNLNSLHVSEEEYLNKPSTSTENVDEPQIQEATVSEEPKIEAPTEEIPIEIKEEPTITVSTETVVESEVSPVTEPVEEISTEESPVEEIKEEVSVVEEVPLDSTFTDNGDGFFTEESENDEEEEDFEDDEDDVTETEDIASASADPNTTVLLQPTHQPRPHKKNKHRR